MRRGLKGALACAAILAVAQVAWADAARYRSPQGSFAIPSGWKVEKAADVTADAELGGPAGGAAALRAASSRARRCW